MWHAKSADETLSDFSTPHDGLSSDRVEKARQQFGENRLATKKEKGLLAIFCAQWINPLVFVLLVAAGVKLSLQSYLDGVVIFATILVMVIVGFIQEVKAEKAMSALKDLATPLAKVQRDGHIHELPSSELVPGDILVVETGDKIAGDARIISVNDLQVNESLLTGESLPIHKAIDPLDAQTPLAERKNMLYSGSLVTHGRGYAVVVATGMETEIGKIAKEIQSVEKEQTPLQKSIHRLSNMMLIGVVCYAALFFFFGIVFDLSWLDIVLMAIAISVAAIPEGLPATVTVVLATGVHRLAKKKGIIRKLVAVETLGSTQVICTDKTGTLTKNEMEWTTYATHDALYECHTLAQDDLKKHPSFVKLLEIAVLCNDATPSQKDPTTYLGDPTEVALLQGAFTHFGYDPSFQETHPRRGEIPFSSERQYMLTCHEVDGEESFFIKGALEKLLPECEFFLEKETPSELDETRKQQIAQKAHELAEKGMRVLLGAYKKGTATELTQREENPALLKGLVFTGLFGINDPPREEVKEAIDKCHNAGIEVTMVTGDSRETAVAIAQALGIRADHALTGADIATHSEADFEHEIKQTSVFARIEPGHKLNIVKAYKKQGLIVGMTGDGVNDAPALEQADIGIAMGEKGTDVAKEASDIILTDDNFTTIVDCIEEGRSIFTRIRAATTFLLITSLGEVATIFLAFFTIRELPLEPIQILWINLITGSLIAVPIGLEPKTGDELQHPPRDPRVGLVYPGMVYRVLTLAAMLSVGAFCVYYAYSDDMVHAQTMTFASIVLFEWAIALHMRSDEHSVMKLGIFSNTLLFLMGSIALSLLAVIIYVPWLQESFHTRALSGFDWLICLLPSLFVCTFESLRKKCFPKLFSFGKWKKGAFER